MCDNTLFGIIHLAVLQFLNRSPYHTSISNVKIILEHDNEHTVRYLPCLSQYLREKSINETKDGVPFDYSNIFVTTDNAVAARTP